MAEWSIAHAWKSTLLARADAHEIPPTHCPINDFRNNDVPRRVPVNDDVDRGFRGVCDTVLTQFRFALATTDANAYRAVPHRSCENSAGRSVPGKDKG